MPNLVKGLPEVYEDMVEVYFEVYEDMVEVMLVLEIFLTEDLRLKICSVVLLPARKPACSSAMIISACGFNLSSMIFSMTLLWWLMRPIVRWFWHCCKLPFLGCVMTKDCMDPRGWPFSCLPHLVADCRDSSDYILPTCLDQFCWDVVDSG